MEYRRELNDDRHRRPRLRTGPRPAPRRSPRRPPSTPSAVAASLPLETKVALLTGATTWTLPRSPRSASARWPCPTVPSGARTGGGRTPSARLPARRPPPRRGTRACPAASRRSSPERPAARASTSCSPRRQPAAQPRGRRHFECLSEDPLLTARLGAAFVSAVQDADGIRQALRRQRDRDRRPSTAPASTLARSARCTSPRSSPSSAPVRGPSSATTGCLRRYAMPPPRAHGPLLNGLLKGEWGFDGVIVSDWLATRDTVDPALGGLDLVMPARLDPGARTSWTRCGRPRAGVGRRRQGRPHPRARRPRRGTRREAGRPVSNGDPVGSTSTTPPPRTRPDARRSSPSSPRPPPASGRAPERRRHLPSAGRHPEHRADRANAEQPFTQGGGSAFVSAPHISDPLEALRTRSWPPWSCPAAA